MNKTCFHIGESCYVVDENGEFSKEVRYTEFTDEILIQEDYIEEIEDRLDEARVELNRINAIPSSKLFTLLGIGAIALVSSVIVGSNLFGYGKVFLDTFDMVSDIIFVLVSFGVIKFIDRKLDIIRDEGCDLARNITVLESLLNTAKEKLQELKQKEQSASVVATKNVRVVDIDRHQQLEELRSLLDHYTDDSLVETEKTKVMTK